MQSPTISFPVEVIGPIGDPNEGMVGIRIEAQEGAIQCVVPRENLSHGNVLCLPVLNGRARLPFPAVTGEAFISPPEGQRKVWNF